MTPHIIKGEFSTSYRVPKGSQSGSPKKDRKMKILGWMHRKFRQNELLKDLSLGQPPLDDQLYNPKAIYGIKSLDKAQRDNYIRKSFVILEAGDKFEYESSAADPELFHGFLTIGTLGSDSVITDPSKPTFSISVQNIAEKESEVTEDELKLINEELEKVLGAECKEDDCSDSSGRNSHVSIVRSSHFSTITSGGKTLEGTETSGNGTAICPLQGYLFSSAIELPEATTVVKEENRTSLGELFQLTKLPEQNTVGKWERGEERPEKETEKSAIHLMKKMLKKRMVRASSRSSTTAAGENIDSASMVTKLHKILHKFDRKVHPESSKAAQKSHKNDIKNFAYEGDYTNGQRVLLDEVTSIIPQRSLSKESTRCFKSYSIPPNVTISGSDSNGSSEYWIKTDANYLVLEL